MKSSISERIRMVLSFKGVKPKQFSDISGFNYKSLNAILNGKMGENIKLLLAIKSTFPDISQEWLLTGEGNMTDTVPYSMNESQESYLVGEMTPYTGSSGSGDKVMDSQNIPLYDISAAAGLKLLLDGNKENIIDNIRIPNVTRADGAMFISGDSMYPLLKSGDIVIFKKINDLNYLQYGDIYLISYSINGDDYLVIKYAQKSDREGHIRLVSYNEHHQPVDIPLATINAMAVVKASIRYNTMF